MSLLEEAAGRQLGEGMCMQLAPFQLAAPLAAVVAVQYYLLISNSMPLGPICQQCRRR